MKKKGRPKGAKTTVIGLLQAKKAKRCYQKAQTLLKIWPVGKGQGECFTNKVNVVAAIDGSRFLSIDDLFGSNAIPDTVCDENIDVHRVEKILITLDACSTRRFP